MMVSRRRRIYKNMSSKGLCLIASLPIFRRVLFKLSLFEIYKLMTVNSSFRNSIVQTNLYRILIDRSDEQSLRWIKPYLIAQYLEVKRTDPNPFIYLMINAVYLRDIELIEYSIERYRITKMKKAFDYEYKIHALHAAMASSTLIGGFDESTIDWLKTNYFAESSKNSLYFDDFFDYVRKDQPKTLMRYSSTGTYHFINFVVDKFTSSQDLGGNKAYYKMCVIEHLHQLFTYCLGHADLYVANHIIETIERLNAPGESDDKTSKDKKSDAPIPNPFVFFTDKLFVKMLYVLLLNPNTEAVINILEHLREKFEWDVTKFCTVCHVTLDVDNGDILAWVEKYHDLGELLLTKYPMVNSPYKNPPMIYLLKQIFESIFYTSKREQRLFRMVQEVISSHPVSDKLMTDVLKSMLKRARHFGVNPIYIEWLSDTIDDRSQRLLSEYGWDYHESDTDDSDEDDIDFWLR